MQAGGRQTETQTMICTNLQSLFTAPCTHSPPMRCDRHPLGTERGSLAQAQHAQHCCKPVSPLWGTPEATPAFKLSVSPPPPLERRRSGALGPAGLDAVPACLRPVVLSPPLLPFRRARSSSALTWPSASHACSQPARGAATPGQERCQRSPCPRRHGEEEARLQWQTRVSLPGLASVSSSH